MVVCYLPPRSDALTIIRQLIFVVFIAAPVSELWAGLRISEFVASNGSGLFDEDGDYGDWIEIENTEIEGQSIGGYFLSDDADNLQRWRIPDGVELGAGDFLLVKASGKDRAVGGSELHTRFRLSKAGGSLFLVAPDGETIIDAARDYPKQRVDVSYGRAADGEWRFFLNPTPGLSAEGGGVLGFVGDTAFDIDRGFFDEAIDVVISTATEGARIYYTTDGSMPTEANGLLYAEPVPVTSTTILRAVAVANEMVASNVDTQTYVFPADVLLQDGDGLPDPPRPSTSDWDYEIDPKIVGDPRFSELEDDLKALRTLSVVLPVGDLWERDGIYANPTRQGAAWERACSVEVLVPENPRENYQQDGGIRMQGAGSRFRNIGKKSMRLVFRNEYGDGKLRYPLFGDANPREFDTIVLRGSYFDSFTVHTAGNGAGIGWLNALQFRTDFGHETHLEMGGQEILRDWVHLYLNGQYWGIYNIHERPDESFAKLHFGGREKDYDVLKQRPRGRPNGSLPELTSGSLDAWKDLMVTVKGATEQPEVYAEILRQIELEPFIDYILMNLWGGNSDWPHNNWYAIRHAPTDGPFQFFNWDPENYIFAVNVNRVGVNTDNSPGILFSRLRRNAEFRLRFADQVHQHCFNAGALTPGAAAARFKGLVERLQGPMNAESARWGDERVSRPLNTLDTWLPTVDDKLRNYFPRRTDILLSQLRSAGLYPEVVAPELNVHGGDFSNPVAVTMEAPSGVIYYTTDGSDPRRWPVAEGSALIDDDATARALVPSVENGGEKLGDSWWQPEFDDNGWKPGVTGVGFEAASGYESHLGLELEEMYRGNDSVFVRVPFAVADQAAIDGLPKLFLSMKYDDGFVAYLNGVEVIAKNVPAERTWQSAATTSNSDSRAMVFEEFDISGYLGALRVGMNVLAIHGMNQVNSNDLLLSPKLSGRSAEPAGGVSGLAVEYSNGLVVSETTTIKARVLEGGEWSALTEASFRVGVEAATGENLLVSEVHYHPREASESEQAAGYGDQNQFEFIELLNPGGVAVDFTGLRFAGGIGFDFLEGTVLAAGARLVLVRDGEAFNFRYPGVVVNGEYSGSLANSGERILLVGSEDEALVDFSYDEGGFWPAEADGDGFSLELEDEDGVPEYGLASSWRRSLTVHGTPGSRGGFFGDPDADDDGDGQSAFGEYAFGTSDANAGENGTLRILSGADGRAEVGFMSNIDAVGVRFVIEWSQDLASWQIALQRDAEVKDLDGRRLWNRYEIEAGGAEERPVFLRVRAVSVAGK